MCCMTRLQVMGRVRTLSPVDRCAFSQVGNELRRGQDRSPPQARLITPHVACAARTRRSSRIARTAWVWVEDRGPHSRHLAILSKHRCAVRRVIPTDRFHGNTCRGPDCGLLGLVLVSVSASVDSTIPTEVSRATVTPRVVCASSSPAVHVWNGRHRAWLEAARRGTVHTTVSTILQTRCVVYSVPSPKWQLAEGTTTDPTCTTIGHRTLSRPCTRLPLRSFAFVSRLTFDTFISHLQ